MRGFTQMAAAGVGQGRAAGLATPPRPAARAHVHRHSHQHKASFLELCLRTCALWSPAVLGTSWSMASSAAKRCGSGGQPPSGPAAAGSGHAACIGGNPLRRARRACARSRVPSCDRTVQTLALAARLGGRACMPARPAEWVCAHAGAQGRAACPSCAALTAAAASTSATSAPCRVRWGAVVRRAV